LDYAGVRMLRIPAPRNVGAAGTGRGQLWPALPWLAWPNPMNGRYIARGHSAPRTGNDW